MDGREHYGFIIATSVLPLLGIAGAIVLLWNHLVGPVDMIVLGVMYVIAVVGVSIGYHRLLAHRSFQTYKPIRVAFAAAGAVAGQGPPITWVAHHRRHHRVADKDGDPHSPWEGEEPGLRGALKGLWHAHMGWLLDTSLESNPLRYCPDVVRQRSMRFLSHYFFAVVAAGIVFPGLLGWAVTGDWRNLLTGMLWGGLVRIFVVNHITYAINSIGHYFGRRRFATPDESRNMAWLSLLSFGESWHNNHHAFPRSARHGLGRGQVDLSAMLISLMRRLRLVWNVIVIDQERQRVRAEGLLKVGGGRTAASDPSVPMANRPKDEQRDLVPSAPADVE